MELKANELRIGNYVTCGKENHIVSHLHHDDTIRVCKDKESAKYWSFYNLDVFKPIPLTEEWLFKFGFELKYGCFLLSTNRGTILIEEDLAQISSVISHDGFMAHCQFVHQLQNLYFALTNKELEIKM